MPNRNAYVSDSSEIAEARTTLRAVADRIELDLAPLIAAAAVLRDAARTAPAVVGSQGSGEGRTAEAWAVDALDHHAGELRAILRSMRGTAGEDFAASLRDILAA